MAQKRRRQHSAELQNEHYNKRPKNAHHDTATAADSQTSIEKVHHHVLSAYFPTLLVLRKYLIARLSSLKRTAAQEYSLHALLSDQSKLGDTLSQFLDSALVGFNGDVARGNPDIMEAIEARPLRRAGRGPSQSEVVDVAIRILCSRKKGSYPANIITCGYRLRGSEIISSTLNTFVQTLKSPIWQRLLELVGEAVMLEMLLNGYIFIAAKNSCYYQLTGSPISERTLPTHVSGQLLPQAAWQTTTCQVGKRPMTDTKNVPGQTTKKAKLDTSSVAASLSGINFARSKMFYAKPMLNSSGKVRFGFRHNYLLKRYPNGDSKDENIHVLQHIFPKQFGLSNVLTSGTRIATNREDNTKNLKGGRMPLVPKRLQGSVITLIAQLQKLQSQCPYHILLRYYCPVFQCDQGAQDRHFILPVIPKPAISTGHSSLVTQLGDPASTDVTSHNISLPRTKVSPTEYASSVGEVSTFVLSVIKRVIPRALLGGPENQKSIMWSINRFIRLRRFESMSLHDIMQGLKINKFSWLVPFGMDPSQKMSLSDKNKRTELLAEFMYWLFESFIVPLVSAHFYITESSISNSQKIFYFRHDLWRTLAEPALQDLKLVMFKECPTPYNQPSRRLGHCQVRLLPKENGFRPIMNLAKRPTMPVSGLSKVDQGKSINSILQPVFSILKYEKNRGPDYMGSTILNPMDIYPKLKAFKTLIQQNGWRGKKLYFVKLDIKACFDTIPQRKLLELVENMLIEDEYRIEFHAEIKPADYYGRNVLPGRKAKVFRRFLKEARGEDDFEPFEDLVLRNSVAKRNVVFVDKGYKRHYRRQEILGLLKEHVQRNTVKIDNKFYSQKEGIPQGSVLSTILSGILYGALERDKLPFCMDNDGILIRLVDDFLFITLNRKNATNFLSTMYRGLPEYGAKIAVEKCLVNFETSVDGNKINRLVGTLEFPYCGNTIHTKTLDFRKDMDRRRDSNLRNSLTTVVSKNVGRALHQKTVKAFKMNAHTMFFDPQHNSRQTILTNIYRNFAETAMKCYCHCKSLPPRKLPRAGFMTKIVSDILDFAFTMLKNRQWIAGNLYTTISESQVKWLGAFAFFTVFKRKQSNYHGLLHWLQGVIEKHPPSAMCSRVATAENSTMASRTY